MNARMGDRAQRVRRGYEGHCAHCKKEIHPYRGSDNAAITEAGILAAVSFVPDCVYLVRYWSGPMPDHGRNNYLCAACDAELDAWLREGGTE